MRKTFLKIFTLFAFGFIIILSILSGVSAIKAAGLDKKDISYLPNFVLPTRSCLTKTPNPITKRILTSNTRYRIHISIFLNTIIG